LITALGGSLSTNTTTKLHSARTTKCPNDGVVVLFEDESFRKEMEFLKDLVFTALYRYFLTEARKERVEQFKAAQEKP
jgi:hypothetical protein